MILETIILLYRICSQFILGNVALEGTANIFHGFFLGNAVLEGNAATTVRVRYLVSLPLGLRLGLSLFELGYDIRRSFGASQTHHQGMRGRHTTRGWPVYQDQSWPVTTRRDSGTDWFIGPTQCRSTRADSRNTSRSSLSNDRLMSLLVSPRALSFIRSKKVIKSNGSFHLGPMSTYAHTPDSWESLLVFIDIMRTVHRSPYMWNPK